MREAEGILEFASSGSAAGGSPGFLNVATHQGN